jgi:N-acetylneuraminic acid mutarotase
MKKAILLVLLLVLSLAAVSLAAEDIWTQKADMPTARFGFAASVVNGKIYVIGGEQVHNNLTPFTVVEMYNPATDTWKRKVDMPTGREGLATAVVDGKIYAIGGQRGAFAMVSTVEVYDPATDTWERRANMPTARGWASASTVNGKIYLSGGFVVPTMEEYDPVTDTWTRKASMPTSTYGFSTSVVNGKIYALGGITWDQEHLSNVFEYDPAKNKWTQKASMPNKRALLSTCVVNEKIYAIGGSTFGSVGLGLPTVEVYDPVTDSWEKKTDMPTGRHMFAGGMVDGKIYVIGGKSGSLCLSSVEEYDPYPLFVDFNFDGIVDAADMCIMIDHWGEDYSLCDIGPMPWGDGIIDVRDLIILAEQMYGYIQPAAHWTLNETAGDTAYDKSGKNDALVYGGALWQPTGGKVGGALMFDGSDDYVGTTFILNPGKTSFSVTAWIRGGATGQVIISQADVEGQSVIESGGTWLGISQSDGRLMTGLMDIFFGPLESESVVADGQWHHVGLVYDITAMKRYLYVDGAQIAVDAGVVGGVQSTAGLYIGAGQTLDAGSFFSGLIDDVRIYDVALSPEKIEALAQ